MGTFTGCSPKGYKLFYEAYRALGAEAHTKVAKRLNVNYRTAKKVWCNGAPPDLPPLQEVFMGTVPLPECVISLPDVTIHDNTLPYNMLAADGEKPPRPDRASAPTPEAARVQTEQPGALVLHSPTPAEVSQAQAEGTMHAQLAAARALPQESAVVWKYLEVNDRMATAALRVLNTILPLLDVVEQDAKVLATGVKRISANRVLKLMEQLARIVNTTHDTFEAGRKTSRLVSGQPQQISEERHKDDRPDADQQMRLLVNALDILSRAKPQVIDVEVRESSGNPAATDVQSEPKPAEALPE